MVLNEFQSTVFLLLTEHEELISQLYRTFADEFSGLAGFWNSIAEEELVHASLLKSLRESIHDGDAHFSKGSFPLESIKFSIVSVRKTINEVKSGQVPLLITALALAKDYENSLIEKDYFKVVEGDSAEVKATLLRLVEDGKKHRAKIEQKLAELA